MSSVLLALINKCWCLQAAITDKMLFSTFFSISLIELQLELFREETFARKKLRWCEAVGKKAAK